MTETEGELSLPASVRIADDVLWQPVDGQVVLVELNAGRYYTLDPVGSRIWEVLVECSDPTAAHEQLLEVFDVDAGTLWRDLAELIERLTTAHLLVSVR